MLMLLTVRKHGRHKSGFAFWEYRISYKDPFTNQIKSKYKRGFQSKNEAHIAAAEMVNYIKYR